MFFRDLKKRFERYMLAVTFAEAGDEDTARRIICPGAGKRARISTECRNSQRTRPRAQLRV